MIAIVDYGMGNVGSILNMLRKAGAEAAVTCEVGTIRRAQKVILPGVGSFDHAIRNLDELGLRTVLRDKVLEEKVPTLGICLGMQLFCRRSDEGTLAGLNWIEAETIRLSLSPEEPKRKIPHMGWESVEIKRAHPLLAGLEEEPRFYFVHSFRVRCDDQQDVLATCRYGTDIAVAIAHDNIMGTQFHPEKSHRFGLRVLRNFAEMA